MSKTEEQVRDAIAALLSVCDGAVERDGQGFNGRDAGWARTLHIQPVWTAKQLCSAHKMLCKYKVQLSGFGIDYDAIEAPPKPIESSGKPLVSWNHTLKVFQVLSHYDHRENMRAIPTAKFNGQIKQWEVRPTIEAIAAIKGLTAANVVEIAPSAVEVLEAVHVDVTLPEPQVRQALAELDYNGEYLLLTSPFEFKDIAKSIPNRRWIAETKQWRYLPTAEVVDAWNKVMDDHEVKLTEGALKFFQAKAAEVIAQREQKIKAKAIKEGEVPDIPVPLKVKPFDHQKRAFALATTLDHAALLMEQGTGKTLVAIADAGKRYLDGQVKKVLVICPKSVVPVWEAEFNKHANFPVKTFPLNQRKMSHKKDTILSAVPNNGSLIVVIVNYASAWRLVPELQHWAPDMVICDESQNLKNGQAQQSKGCTAIGSKAKHRLILTGTPVSQGPMDFFSQYKFLDDRIFGKSFPKYRDQFAIMGGYCNHEIVGLKNLETLTAKAHSIAFRVTKAEALDLPETLDQNLYCYLEESSTAYQEMEKKMVTTLKEGEVSAPIVLTQLLRLQQITGGFLPMEEGNPVQVGSEKLKVFKEFLEDFPKEKKLVVVARFIPELHALKQICDQLGRTASVFYGATENRGEIVRKFQEEKDPNVLLIQIQTGGVGITLHRADTMMFYSMDFSYNNYEQVKARVHRIGQANKVTYIHLLAKDTVDETILTAIQNKRDVAELVVDKMRNNSLF